MKISARNVLTGTVKNVTIGAVNAEVTLALEGGETVVAIITNYSVDSLGLREGNPAYAIIKASEVMIGKNVESAGAVVTSITKTSVSALDLQHGDKVSAIIKASNVLLGV